MAGVKTLHELMELDTTAFSHLSVKLMWMGLERTITHVPKRAKPMDPETLLKIRDTLDLEKPNEMAFWALCLTAFFILARKSNLMPVKEYQSGKQLARQNLKFAHDYVDVYIHWTKTRWPNEEPLVYPLSLIPGSALCPFTALRRMVEMIPAQGDVPCFMWENGCPITYYQFSKKLKGCLKRTGVNPEGFSSHSFRSGGSSWAKRSGVPGELIKLLGGWKSDAYLRYLEFPHESCKIAGLLMKRKIMQLGL